MFERKGSKPEPAPAAPAQVSDTPTASRPKAASAPPPVHEAKAMIGSKVKVTGDIESSEDLLVEGEVNGTIKLADNELIIGNSGRLQANIEAKSIRIEGEVHGDIVGQERVIITATGNVQGNVSAPRVMLEDGGRFKGSIDMGSPVKSASTAPSPRATSGTPSQDVKATEQPGAKSA